jgi:hypothetical protein
MSLLTTIKNLMAPALAAPKPASPGQPATLLPATAVSPGDLDSFDKKFSSLPYFHGGFFRKGSGFSVFDCSDRPRIPGKVWQMVYESAGGERGIFTDVDRKKLAEISRQRKVIAEKQGAVTIFSVGRIYQELQQAGGRSFLEGGSPLPPGPTAVSESLASVRRFLFESERQLSTEAFDLIKPMCLKMRDSARSLAIFWDEKLRAQHALFSDNDAEFQPTEFLRSLIFVALSAYSLPARHFKVTGWMAAPPEKNLLSLWYAPPVKPIVPPAIRPRQATTDTQWLDRERQAVETEMAARRIAVQEKGRQIEKFKRQFAAELEAKKNAEAHEEAEQETRKQSALDSLKNQKPEVQP